MTRFSLLIATTVGAFAISYAVVKHNQPASESIKRIERPPREATAAPPDMVWIPGGDFTMGSDHPLGRKDELPLHQVHVDGFWMDVTEVTNAQFRKFVETTGLPQAVYSNNFMGDAPSVYPYFLKGIVHMSIASI